MVRLLSILVVAAALSLAAPLARATTKVVDLSDLANMPTFDQLDDYFGLMQGRLTDLVLPRIGLVPYESLPNLPPLDLQPVRLDPFAFDPWYWDPAPPAPGDRLFVFDDYIDLAGGLYHCWPAVAAMVMDYYAKRPGLAKLGQGSVADSVYIDEMAWHMDTNDQNTLVRNGDDRGHFGTFNARVVPGVEDFALVRDSSLVVTAKISPFAEGTYRTFIDNDVPVMLYADTRTLPMGHALVGIGYEVDERTQMLTRLNVRDPLPGADALIGIPQGALAPLSVAGARFNSFGDIGIATADDPLENAMMFTFSFEPGGGASVPEPATTVLCLVGGFALFAHGWRRRRMGR